MFFHDCLSRMLQDEHGISITRMAEEDVAATLQISSVLVCRGGRAMAMPNQALAVQQPQGQMQFEQMMQMMMDYIAKVSTTKQSSEPEINILVPLAGAGRTQGRPMRSLSLVGTTRIATDPPLSVCGSTVPLDDAPSPSAIRTTDAGDDLFAESVVKVANASVVEVALTPKKVPHDSMEDVRAKMLSRTKKHDEVPEMEVAKPETVLRKRPASADTRVSKRQLSWLAISGNTNQQLDSKDLGIK